MEREIDTKILLSTNIQRCRKLKKISRKQLALLCGKDEESKSANVWGSNIELMSKAIKETDPDRLSKWDKKCPFLTVFDLLTICEALQATPDDLLQGAEKIFDLPQTESETLSTIVEMLNRINEKGLQRLQCYVDDILKIDEYIKEQ